MARGNRWKSDIDALDDGSPEMNPSVFLSPATEHPVEAYSSGVVVPPGPEIEDEPKDSDFREMLRMSGFQEFSEDGDLPGDEGFDDNLAEYLPQQDRDMLAQRICDWVRVDRASRQGWEDREARGIIALGVTDEEVRKLTADNWQSTAVHPGLAQACINFWARAFGELWQGGKLAKAIVLGDTSPELEQQAQRVADYLNYLYQEEMPAADDELSRLLFRLPLSGSVFRKAYFDPIERTVVVEFIESADLVKPYKASDLRKAPRFTHIVRMTRNDLDRLVIEGYYLDEVKTQPQSEAITDAPIEAVINDATGQQELYDAGQNPAEYDHRDTLYECACILNLSDYGWEDPLGEQWGVPYLVTVHAGDLKTLSIRRNWRPSDQSKRRRLFVSEYKFLPGLDGYGFGLLHIAGDLAAAQSGMLRYVLDGNSLDTQGKLSGWVSQEVVGAGEMPAFELGKFRKIPQGSADELRKGLVTPDFKWSPANTLEILKYLDGLMSFLVSSTESLIGDKNQDVPVGTVLARIEQGLKPFVSIFTLLHASLKRELRAVAELVADNLPDEGYPYQVEGVSQMVLATDFDDRVDVIPASDPNIVTGMQRIAMAQLVEQTVMSDPEVFGPRQRMEAHRNVLESARVPNVERYFVAANEPLPIEQQQMQAQAQQQAQQAAAEQQAMAQASGIDPVAADAARKDAETGAKIQATQAEIARKDAEAQARIDAQAKQMQVDPALQRQGDQAIQSQAQDAEIADIQRQILERAAARKQDMMNQAGVAA